MRCVPNTLVSEIKSLSRNSGRTCSTNDTNHGTVGVTDPNLGDVDIELKRRRVFEGVTKNF